MANEDLSLPDIIEEQSAECAKYVNQIKEKWEKKWGPPPISVIPIVPSSVPSEKAIKNVEAFKNGVSRRYSRIHSKQRRPSYEYMSPDDIREIFSGYVINPEEFKLLTDKEVMDIYDNWFESYGNLFGKIAGRVITNNVAFEKAKPYDCQCCGKSPEDIEKMHICHDCDTKIIYCADNLECFAAALEKSKNTPCQCD